MKIELGLWTCLGWMIVAMGLSMAATVQVCSRLSPAADFTNGTTLLLFPEWEKSESAFERKVYTNYYVVYQNGTWLTKERQTDGSMTTFWKTECPNKTVDEAKQAFSLNIQWNVYKGIYDTLSKTNVDSRR